MKRRRSGLVPIRFERRREIVCADRFDGKAPVEQEGFPHGIARCVIETNKPGAFQLEMGSDVFMSARFYSRSIKLLSAREVMETQMFSGRLARRLLGLGMRSRAGGGASRFHVFPSTLRRPLRSLKELVGTRGNDDHRINGF